MSKILMKKQALLIGINKYEILPPLRQLDDYKLGWKPNERLLRARTLWSEQRPCVVKAEEERQK